MESVHAVAPSTGSPQSLAERRDTPGGRAKCHEALQDQFILSRGTGAPAYRADMKMNELCMQSTYPVSGSHRATTRAVTRGEGEKQLL